MSSLDRLAGCLAVAGVLLALAVAAMVTASVLVRWATTSGVPGDFELVQIATALAVFSFLPWAQARRGHVRIETFTRHLSSRTNARLDALWDVVLAAASLVIAWRLAVGAAETISSRTTSMVLALPYGWVIAACAAIAGMLAAVSLATAAARLAESGQ